MLEARGSSTRISSLFPVFLAPFLFSALLLPPFSFLLSALLPVRVREFDLPFSRSLLPLLPHDFLRYLCVTSLSLLRLPPDSPVFGVGPFVQGTADVVRPYG